MNKELPRTTVYHDNLTSPEEWGKVSKRNKDLFFEFSVYLKNTDHSQLTLINYQSDLKIFFTWNLNNNENKNFEELRISDFTMYQGYMLDLDLSGNRIRRMKAALSSMCNWFELQYGEKYPLFRNTVNKVPSPAKEPVREKTVLEDDQIDELLKWLADNGQFQEACLLAFGASCGRRKSEVLRVKVRYFEDKYVKFGTLYRSPEKIKTKGHGHMGKRLTVWTLVHPFKEYFDLWMKERERLGVKSEWLFVTQKNGVWEQMKTSTVDTYCEHWSEHLGITVYFHCLRHYWTSALSRANLPSSIIQFLQGWASSSMVELYNDNDMEDDLGQFFANGSIVKQDKKGLRDV